MTWEIILVGLIWTCNVLLGCYLLAMWTSIHYDEINERAAYPEFYKRYDQLLR